MRGVSTVLDASLCLLLVSASVLTLAGTPLARESRQAAAAGPDTADELAEVLATSTGRVTYSVGGRIRTAHDTLAGLLAAAAVADAESDASLADAESGTGVTDAQRAARAFQRAAVERVARSAVIAHRGSASRSSPVRHGTVGSSRGPDPRRTPTCTRPRSRSAGLH